MKVRLEEGSGGAPMAELLEKWVFPALKNDLLAQGHDAAQLEAVGPLAITTDSYVVKPLFFPGGDIGKLAACGTLNDLAMAGAKPLALTLGLILEEGFDKRSLQVILTSLAAAARAAGVEVVTGDTKVVEAGKGDGLYLNTTGIGRRLRKEIFGPGSLQVGQKILINGGVAQHGLAILAAREGLDLGGVIESDCADLSGLCNLLVEQFAGVRLLKDPTRGGLASTLNELAQASGLCLELHEPSIPIDPKVEAGCGLLGLDPLSVANEGKFLAFVDPQAAPAVLEALLNHPLGQGAAIIGEVKAAPERKVVLVTSIGTRRVLDSPMGEQLPRIC
ncbi:MAG: hydrogenase expression/formation protein HypE [Candidatus Lambdaproteobacteria bacterium RIFOXYD1_FULL_56_27]|uniref:Hydrogenase expression/formation protein HypE n=1 Tax=Candidatus Lambdaproteobacteria bacterium RIFOXYD2_FULL_56_26 TaxID=1817773 RepID=A0A1F6GVK7_9PROT|nr:MAG: hydrogenase expression/formation protein HypE [Candidatus Lambdaproteobacteria bacterium RIFOXYC1_FULL_56_13]OGH02070.1 MAG: hydrogenase expression/formation protein HypE [Candidatus Lambdaproteobacteria bacterium RIFOXYD2_FULL_56_26]OGH07720.1 MAG: hydrogenase expression/formation protein HypE [Candidatus Lambdaproteobacteria bacterium RIFOXYD1_FULL_56_27]